MNARRAKGRERLPAPFQVGPGMWVRLRYEGRDGDGEPVEDGAHEVAYVHGFGQLLARVEAALEGSRAGDACQLTLAAGDAFGARRKEAIVEIERGDFPSDVAAGDRFDADSVSGECVLLRVLEVGEDFVLVDTNHPLAGQSLRLELSVLEVRPASAAELEAETGRLAVEQALPALISADRLLRGPPRRYESSSSGPPEGRPPQTMPTPAPRGRPRRGGRT